MRIAVINHCRRKVGGTETYLSQIIPALARMGHKVAFWHESEGPLGRDPIIDPEIASAWCISESGVQPALSRLGDWRPELIYSHGLVDPRLELRTLAAAPAVFFAHNYYGTCITGAKTFKFPVVTPCSRQFGWQCLMHFYPHRCGGGNPLTMAREYRRQSRRLKLLRGYRAILTFSGHMASEYIKHGFPADRIYTLRSIQNGHSSNDVQQIPEYDLASEQRQTLSADQYSPTNGRSRPFWRLLFLGRMESLKGGRVFLEALPQVVSSLDRPLRVTFAGDGPDRDAWERQAVRARDQSNKLQIEFVGWRVGREREALLADADLLVMPSQWPEPFGQSGLQACARGVPVVAFAVGGIPEWLADGVNGYLAPGNPPTAAGLSEAIVRALHDPQTHARLRQGAFERAHEHTVQEHLAQLIPVLERYAR